MATLPSCYAPDFDLTLNGQSVPDELRGSITRVRFEDSLQAADRVEVELANPNLVFLDNRLLDLGVEMELSLGYQPGGLRRVFQGNVTGVQPSFPASGMPTITITAHDFLQKLSEGTKDRCFPYYIPDATVAAIVAAENQLLTMPDAPSLALTGAVAILGRFNEKPIRYQHSISDYAFLRGIAAEYGMEMWVDGRVLNFKLLLPFLPSPDVELRWGESLIDFSPRLTSIGQVAAVRAKLWVEALKTQFSVEVSWDGDKLSVRVVPALLQRGSGISADLPDIPFDHPIDCIKRVISELKRRVNSRLTAHGSAVGDPRIRAGEVIALDNLGKFSGRNYRLTSVSHSLDSSGYRTSFDVRQEWV